MWLDLSWRLDRLRAAIAANNPAAIREKMKEIVPEYDSDANGLAETTTARLAPIRQPESRECTNPIMISR